MSNQHLGSCQMFQTVCSAVNDNFVDNFVDNLLSKKTVARSNYIASDPSLYCVKRSKTKSNLRGEFCNLLDIFVFFPCTLQLNRIKG